MKKQYGFLELSLISLLVVLSALTVAIIHWSNVINLKTQADKSAEIFKSVVAACMAYRQDNGSFPSSISELVPNYLSSQAETNAWGKAYSIEQSDDNIIVSNTAISAKTAGFMAASIPLATVTGYTVSATYGRPGTEPALENLVRRDGTTSLTSEWDVGGYGISNVKDMTITGLTNRTVVQGLNYSTVVQNSGTVSKLTCPSGYTNHIFVSPVAMNYNGYPFNNFGGFEARYNDLGTYIQAYVRVYAKNSSGSMVWIVPDSNRALVKVDMNCSK